MYYSFPPSPPPPPNHYNRHTSRRDSCCCCDCIRLNSHLLNNYNYYGSREQHQYRQPHEVNQYSGHSSYDHHAPPPLTKYNNRNMTRFPSGHAYNIELEQKKRFFEHFNSSTFESDDDGDDDEHEIFNYGRNDQRREIRESSNCLPPWRRNQWEKPQRQYKQKYQQKQNQRKNYYKHRSPPIIRRLQKHPKPNPGIYQSQRIDQATQTDLRFEKDKYNECQDEVIARNQVQQQVGIDKKIISPPNQFQPNPRKNHVHRHYSYSDMEYNTRAQRRNRTAPVQDKNTDSHIKVISLWRRPVSKEHKHLKILNVLNDESGIENNGVQENIHEEGRRTPHAKFGFPMNIRHQVSREYLDKLKVVQNTRAHWEEKIANENTNWITDRAQISQNYKVNKNQGSVIQTTHSTATIISDGRTKRGEPLSFTSSYTSDNGTDLEKQLNDVEDENSLKRGKKEHHHEIDPAQITDKIGKIGVNEKHFKVTARLSVSSPSLQKTELGQTSSEKGRQKPKSLPSPGKFPHPEYEELNLSSMRLRTLRNNDTGSNPVIPEADTTENQTRKTMDSENAKNSTAAKYFHKWKTGAKKYPKIRPQESRLKDGFQVISKSRSQQNIPNYKELKGKKEKTQEVGGSVLSTVSAPPVQQKQAFKRWYDILNIINPWASTNEYEQEEIVEKSHQSDDLKPPSQVSSISSSAFEVDFAKEMNCQIPTEHATYTDEALRRISRDYDNLHVLNPKVESLDVQRSRLVLNNSRENVQKWEQQHFERDTHEAGLIRKNNSFMKNLENRICQFCLQNISESSEPHQIIHLRGKFIFWHHGCFKCTQCKVQLETQAHYFWNNQVYCANHYAQIAHVPNCKGCSQYIFDSTFTMALGFYWHKAHFQCLHCKRTLIDTKFIKIGQASAICFDCQQTMYSKKCEFCRKTILPAQPYIRSGNHFWHANDSCLRCQTCHKNLRSHSKIFVRKEQTYCNRYCAQMFISPAAAAVV